MSVMEVSHRGKAFWRVARRRRADLRELLAMPRQLQGAVPAGRRDRAVRGDPAEPRARRSDRRLHQHRRLVEEGDRRGAALRARERRGRRGGLALHHVPAAARCKLTRWRAYLHYTPNETIGGVEFPYVPDSGRAAGRRHVLDHPVAADRRWRVRPHLRRRAEEHRTRRPHGGDRARGSHRPRAARDAGGASITRRWRRMARCSTRRRPSPGTSPGWCSSGSRPGRARRDGGAQLAPRRSCCTPPSTAPASTATRSPRAAARG